MKWMGWSLLGLLLTSGCVSTRSISYYDYGYNPSYRGEMSEIEFIKDVSAGNKPTSEPIRIAPGERVIVIQSGQLHPDASLLNELKDHYDVIPMSGIPSEHAVGGFSLREAAQAGGVTKIMAYWGSIETSSQPLGAKAVSWVPIAGWYVPDQSQKMRITLSVIVADAASGHWTYVTASSTETAIVRSMMNAQTRDHEQVAALKEEAYQRLAEKLAPP